MSETALDTIAKLAEVTAHPRGLRTDCEALLEVLDRGVKPLFSCIYLRGTDDQTEPIASTGLEASDFRRLEERLDRTALMRVLEDAEETRLLINDEPTLDFLVRPGVAGEIVCVPVVSTTRVLGAVAAAFDKKKGRVPEDALRIIRVTASLVAGLIRSGESFGIETEKLARENVSLKQELRRRYDLSRVIGNSGAMRSVHAKVAEIARRNATVLLRGESGTGKELIARGIHHNSLRAKGPFVKVNCTTIPDALIESEIFGDASASQARKGRIEEAEGGTLLLDEIGELPQQTQVKLLRLLQDGEYERVGDNETRRARVRLIVLTSRDLEEAVADGILRQDLFFKLNVFTIFLPPLRERKADILLLADHFLRRYSAEHGKNILRISTPAIDMLTAYHFPGNVRELENAIETAVLAADEPVIHGHHLPPSLQTAEQSGTETRVTLESAVAAFEADMIQDALKSTRGNVAKAAVMLASTERILGYKIRKYGILPKRFK